MEYIVLGYNLIGTWLDLSCLLSETQRVKVNKIPSNNIEWSFGNPFPKAICYVY